MLQVKKPDIKPSIGNNTVYGNDSLNLIIQTIVKLNSLGGWSDEVLVFAKEHDEGLYSALGSCQDSIDKAYSFGNLKLLEGALKEFEKASLAILRAYKAAKLDQQTGRHVSDERNLFHNTKFINSEHHANNKNQPGVMHETQQC